MLGGLVMKEKTKKTILLIAICLVTLMVLFIALKLNENRKQELLSTSGMKDYLTEIKYEEIATHVVEQPNTIIYVSNSSDDSLYTFEKEFKTVIKKYNLENEIIYININDSVIVDPIYQNAPELVFYKDGQISDMIDCTTLKSSDEIINVLKERSVISD